MSSRNVYLRASVHFCGSTKTRFTFGLDSIPDQVSRWSPRVIQNDPLTASSKKNGVCPMENYWSPYLAIIVSLVAMGISSCSRNPHSEQSAASKAESPKDVDTLVAFSDGDTLRLYISADSVGHINQKYVTSHFWIESRSEKHKPVAQSFDYGEAECKYMVRIVRDSIFIIESGNLPLCENGSDTLVSICEYVVTSNAGKPQWTYIRGLTPRSAVSKSKVVRTLHEYDSLLARSSAGDQDKIPPWSESRMKVQLSIFGYSRDLFVAALTRDSLAMEAFEHFPDHVSLDGDYGEEYSTYDYLYRRVLLKKQAFRLSP